MAVLKGFNIISCVGASLRDSPPAVGEQVTDAANPWLLVYGIKINFFWIFFGLFTTGVLLLWVYLDAYLLLEIEILTLKSF